MTYFKECQNSANKYEQNIGSVVPEILKLESNAKGTYVVMKSVDASFAEGAKVVDIKLSHTTQWALNKAEGTRKIKCIKKSIIHNIQQYLRFHRMRGWAIIDRNKRPKVARFEKLSKAMEPLLVGLFSESYLKNEVTIQRNNKNNA